MQNKNIWLQADTSQADLVKLEDISALQTVDLEIHHEPEHRVVVSVGASVSIALYQGSPDDCVLG